MDAFTGLSCSFVWVTGFDCYYFLSQIESRFVDPTVQYILAIEVSTITWLSKPTGSPRNADSTFHGKH
jgi:hypothetical protein